MRRSIDDQQVSIDGLAQGDSDMEPMSWAVAICDDYDDEVPRVVLTVEQIGRAGAGMVLHLDAGSSRRLRAAVRDALREVGEDPGN